MFCPSSPTQSHYIAATSAETFPSLCRGYNCRGNLNACVAEMSFSTTFFVMLSSVHWVTVAIIDPRDPDTSHRVTTADRLKLIARQS
jgi:hypothetical protein